MCSIWKNFLVIDFSVSSTFKALNKSQIFEKQLLFKHRVLSLFFCWWFDWSTGRLYLVFHHNPFSLYHWEMWGNSYSFAGNKLLFHSIQTTLPDCVRVTSYCVSKNVTSSQPIAALHQRKAVHQQLKQRDPISPSCQKKYSWSHTLEQHGHRSLQ